MAIRAFCSACAAELHNAPAELIGPPDISGRSRHHRLCRKCFRRVLGYWPALKELARLDRVTPPDGRRPDRPGTRVG